MALIRMGNEMIDPLVEFERLQNEINSLFDVGRTSGSQGLFDRAASPAVDIVENRDDYLVLCDLPGVELSDLEITIASNVLTIKGEKKPYLEDGMKQFKKETWDGNFQRTLSLPESVDSSKVDAVLESGVLRVRLPKKEEVKPRQIKISAK